MGIAALQAQRDGERIVRGTVVDEDDLVRTAQAGSRRRTPLMELAEEGCRSVHRRDDRQRHRRRTAHAGLLTPHTSFMKLRACGPVQKSRSSTETACSNGGYGCGYSG